MSVREQLEQLILGIYRVIHENDLRIPTADPGERQKLERENEQQWSYIKNFLVQYTAICESLGHKAPDNIIEIAAAGSAAGLTDLANRLVLASSGRPKQQRAPALEPTTLIVLDTGPFRMNYHFVHRFLPMDKDVLVQFAVSFDSDDDALDIEPEINTHICLVLDISGSMDTPTKYPYLLQAIPKVIEPLSDNDWLSIILFSNHSELVWSRNIAQCRKNTQDIITRINDSGVKFGGSTLLAPGIQIALDEIKRFQRLQPEIVNRLYILTDGQLHDTQLCVSQNPELRSLGIEINSFGFGQDFAGETMKQIMQGCPGGGRVTWIGNPETLSSSFRHVGNVASRIIATNGELALTFAPGVEPGDAFRFTPSPHWFSLVDNASKRFYEHIGTLEKKRTYTYTFEARIQPARQEHQQIATAMLQYSLQGRQHTIKKDIFVERTLDQARYAQVDQEAENMFLVLEQLRTNDPGIMLKSLQKELEICYREGRDPTRIQLLEKVIRELVEEGSLERLTSEEKEQVRSNIITVTAKQ